MENKACECFVAVRPGAELSQNGRLYGNRSRFVLFAPDLGWRRPALKFLFFLFLWKKIQKNL